MNKIHSKLSKFAGTAAVVIVAAGAALVLSIGLQDHAAAQVAEDAFRCEDKPQSRIPTSFRNSEARIPGRAASSGPIASSRH